MLGKGMIFGNPYVGVFCSANEDLAIVPYATETNFPDKVAKYLGVEHVVKMSVDGCSTIGALVFMNSNCAIVPYAISKDEVNKIAAHLDVVRVPQRHNAMGNNILANDYGAIVHPGFDDSTVERISKALKVPVERGTVAGYTTVGSLAVATNKGVIVHPHSTVGEMDLLESVLGVTPVICTANYGTGQVGACMIANSKGALVGETTTPIEMGKVEEGLHLY